MVEYGHIGTICAPRKKEFLMANDKIFSDEFTNRVMKSAKLGGYVSKSLNEDKKPSKKKVDVDELRNEVRKVLREELQKSPDELEDPMAPPAPEVGAAEAPLPGEGAPEALPGEGLPGEGMDDAGLPGEGMGGEGEGMENAGPLSSVRNAIEGIDWASVSGEDVETLIQDIATGKWGESTDVSTEEGAPEGMPGEGTPAEPGLDTETIGDENAEEDPFKKKPPM